MPEHARFALVERPTDPLCKPKVFPSADALGMALHARRRTRPIMLQGVGLKMEGETKARMGVSVWAINPGDDEPGDYLGWVFIGGLGRRELSELLDRIDPDQPRQAEAA